MPKNITVDGVKYEVVDQPSFNHSIGCQFAFVRTPTGDKPIVKQGKWRFWSAADRVAPLREAAARGWPKSDN